LIAPDSKNVVFEQQALWIVAGQCKRRLIKRSIVIPGLFYHKYKNQRPMQESIEKAASHKRCALVAFVYGAGAIQVLSEVLQQLANHSKDVAILLAPPADNEVLAVLDGFTVGQYQLVEVIAPVLLAPGNIYFQKSKCMQLSLLGDCISIQKADTEFFDSGSGLLQTLAMYAAHATMLVVLSGTSTLLGATALAQAGGKILVQQPATAKYDSLPASALSILAKNALPLVPHDIAPGIISLLQYKDYNSNSLFGNGTLNEALPALQQMARDKFLNSNVHQVLIVDDKGDVIATDNNFTNSKTALKQHSIAAIQDAPLSKQLQIVWQHAKATKQKVDTCMILQESTARVLPMRIICMPINLMDNQQQLYLLLIEYLQSVAPTAAEQLLNNAPAMQCTSYEQAVAQNIAVLPVEKYAELTRQLPKLATL
jgi:hypothetical protein